MLSSEIVIYLSIHFEYRSINLGRVGLMHEAETTSNLTELQFVLLVSTKLLGFQLMSFSALVAPEDCLLPFLCQSWTSGCMLMWWKLDNGLVHSWHSLIYPKDFTISHYLLTHTPHTPPPKKCLLTKQSASSYYSQLFLKRLNYIPSASLPLSPLQIKQETKQNTKQQQQVYF